MPVYEVHHDEDPAAKLFRKAGDLKGYEVFNTHVLLGVYVRPEKTKSGLYTTTKFRDDDKYQAKTCMILKMGPRAFKDGKGVWFEDENGEPIKFAVGDWLVLRANDGWTLTLPIAQGPADDTDIDGKGFACRMIEDTYVRMRVSHADAVY